MNPRQEISRERSQQAIDAEIKSLEESIQALNLRRNALAPISSLPPEVFIAIFSLLCLPGIPSLGRKRGHHLARLRLTHVCHQWREIILDEPLLWSHVDVTTLSSARMGEMLVRSKLVPLYLEGRISIHCWDDARLSIFQEELQAHFPRIYYLSISAEPFYLRPILEGLLSPTPTLEYLSLSSYGKFEDRVMPDTLFDGSAPRLSYLELRHCSISWNSPLPRGLKHLVEILRSSGNARPELAVWLGTLNQMPQLETLTLHSASPVAPPFPFDVERIITLPSLTHLDISASPGDCALALAHLDLPALTSLCLTVIYHPSNTSDVAKLLPYVVQHAHGTQDTQPLQSMLIRREYKYLDIFAWSVPNIPSYVHIDARVHDAPGTTLLPRAAFTFRCKDWHDYSTHHQTLAMVTLALPLDGLVMVSVQGLSSQETGLLQSRKLPLLRRVRLTDPAGRAFILMLLEDKGGSENPLFPSLTELALVQTELNVIWTRSLCDALKKRVEQGVPLETLDLRTCRLDVNRRRGDPAAVQSFTEIVVNVLGLESAFEARV
jgi:hypothetical protein